MLKETIEKGIDLPEGFKAEISGSTVAITGNGKETTKRFKANGISFQKQDNQVTVVGKPASRKINALVNTISSHINNMVLGLQTEYTYKLSIVYSHFPMNIAVKGKVVEINNFVGEKKARTAKILPGATVTVKGKEVLVKSHDKEAAGQTAGNLERASRVKGKDIRIYQDGIFIVRKAEQVTAESK